MKKLITAVVICVVLTGTNIATVIYYENRITDLRSQSSFVVFANNANMPDGNEKLKQCLFDAMIDTKFENNDVLVREVDLKQAAFKCS